MSGALVCEGNQIANTEMAHKSVVSVMVLKTPWVSPMCAGMMRPNVLLSYFALASGTICERGEGHVRRAVYDGDEVACETRAHAFVACGCDDESEWEEAAEVKEPGTRC
jgi:hypothetical protein